MDRMVVMGKDDSPVFMIEGTEVYDLIGHQCKFIMVDDKLVCSICHQPIIENEVSIVNIRS